MNTGAAAFIVIAFLVGFSSSVHTCAADSFISTSDSLVKLLELVSCPAVDAVLVLRPGLKMGCSPTPYGNGTDLEPASVKMPLTLSAYDALGGVFWSFFAKVPDDRLRPMFAGLFGE